MAETTHYGFPLIAASQAQKHVTHNEALVMIDQAIKDGPDSADILGVGGATADVTNRLSVSSPAVLFTHDGAGVQLKVNKAAAGDTASLLFQSGWSGRAEMGLAGNDDFSIKVSNGGAWFSGLVVEAATGIVSFPQGARLPTCTVATLPSASVQGAGAQVYVSNASGGAVVAFSDGTAWRRVTDRDIVT